MKLILENILFCIVLLNVVSCGKSTSSLNDFQIVRGVAQNQMLQSNDYIDLTVEQTDPQKALGYIQQKKSDFNGSLLSLNSITTRQVEAYYPRSGYILTVVRMPPSDSREKVRIDVGVEVNKRHVKVRLRKSDIYPEFQVVNRRKLSTQKMMEFIHHTLFKIISSTILIDDRLSVMALERYFREIYFVPVSNGQYTLRPETQIQNETLEINDSSVEVIAQVYRDL